MKVWNKVRNRVGYKVAVSFVAWATVGVFPALHQGVDLRPTRLARLTRPAVAVAQNPVKARLMGDPGVGSEAPAFSLPYVTAEGPGPADQPFTLRAELGRVVVLAFCRGLTDSAAVALLRTFTARYDSLFPGEVAVAAVLPERGEALTAAARDNALRIKLLADTSAQVRRMYGIQRNTTGVYVIGQTGRVLWRDLRFNPLLATSYDPIRRAVASGLAP